MEPAFCSGQYVIVNIFAYRKAPPRAGDAVVFRDPRNAERLMLKRIAGAAEDNAYLVFGDNAASSTDSRAFGSVARNSFIGKVIARV